MKTITMTILAGCIAAPAMAQDTRALDAHQHGVSTAQIALDGGQLSIGLDAPAMDIVGFEYDPTTEADKAAVTAAIDLLQRPETVVTLPDAVGCSLTTATATRETGEHHEGDHADHAHADHDHDHADHADAAHHDDHADHADADHDGAHHAHPDGEAAKTAAHSAFHAVYLFDCAAPEALTTLTFSFFDQFPDAQEIEVQYVTDAGAGSAEITRDATDLTLE